jgi:hypothetical protein
MMPARRLPPPDAPAKPERGHKRAEKAQASTVADGIGDRFAWLCAVVSANPRLTRTAIIVASCIVSFANSRSGEAWPSQTTVAEWCRLDRKRVRDGIRELEERGLITVANAGTRGRSARYSLAEVGASGRPKGGASGRPIGWGTQTPHQLGHLDAPRTGGNRSNTEGTRKVQRSAPRAGARSADASRAVARARLLF